jgi:hypothetical protein
MKLRDRQLAPWRVCILPRQSTPYYFLDQMPFKACQLQFGTMLMPDQGLCAQS